MPRPPRRTRAAATVPAPASTASKPKQQQESSALVLAADSKKTTAGGIAAPIATPATRGPDASGLDILDDDAFADLNAGDASDLGGNLDLGLDLDLDLEDFDDDLDAFGNESATSTGAGAAEDTGVTHSTDTSSVFSVGVLRRGRRRQVIHSCYNAPIRPSSRGPATPSLSSTFSLGTFKRRRREPSILGANRRRHRRDTSSRHASRDRRDGSQIDDGASGSELDGPATRYTSDADEGTEPEPVLPVRETAIGAATRRSSLASRASCASSALQGDANETRAPDTSLSSVSNSTSLMLLARTRAKAAQIKKRKSEESQRREDVLPKRRATGTGTPFGSDASSVMQSVEVSSVAALSTPPGPSSLPASEADRRRFATPGGPDDEVMAPPMSSGSESSSPAMWPSLKALAHGPRRGGKATAPTTTVATTLPLSHETPGLIADEEDASDISSPPSLTHSPNYRQAPSRAASVRPQRGRSGARASAAKKDTAPLTTAALTALLPQRRRRPRGEDAWSASDDGELERSALLSEDDDELAHYGDGSGRGGLRRGRSAARAAATTTSTTAPTRADQVLSNRGQPAAKPTAAAAKAKAKAKRAVRRTYGSRSFSDKENEAADDSTFAPLPDDAFEADTTDGADGAGGAGGATAARKTRYFGEELEKAAKKFKEVDRWTLEYESVSRSSSPVGAR